MADRLPSLTSALSRPDLPLSTLTSALTSLFLSHPPATDLGSASASPRHGDGTRAANPWAHAPGEVARMCGPERQVQGCCDGFFVVHPARMRQGACRTADAERPARIRFCRILGKMKAGGHWRVRSPAEGAGSGGGMDGGREEVAARPLPGERRAGERGVQEPTEATQGCAGGCGKFTMTRKRQQEASSATLKFP